MTYDDLVADLARRSGLHSDVVKKVLIRLPEVLQDLPLGDAVRTPLGVFRKHRREARPVMLPDGVTPATVAGQTVVRLKPGAKLIESG